MAERVVAGRYRLVRLIGKGAMGSVWSAEHLELQTTVAVKLLAPELARSREARARFQREARVAASLEGPHIVRVLDHGITADAEPYIVMEQLEGETLRDRLASRGRLSLDETARLLSDVAQALGQAHAEQLVHRDIKPENIHFARDGEREVVKVLDFGVAKVTDAFRQDSVGPTVTGTPMGTPLYMSPEQVEGLKSVDFRSDLWALGVLAFECVTGRRPFTADTPGALFMQITMDPIPLPSAVAPELELPAELESWMRRALERNTDLRFASAAELARAFASAVGIPPDEDAVIEQRSEGRDAGVAAPADQRVAIRPLETTLRSGVAPASGGRWWVVVLLAMLGALVVIAIARW